MKRILFFHPDLSGGGAEKVLVDLLNKLDTSQFEITLFTVFKEGVNRANLSPNIHQKWFFTSVFRGYSVLLRLFSPKFLYRFFIKDKYDVVVAYLEGVPTRIVSGCTDLNTKKIAWVHTKIDEIGVDKVFNGRQGMINAYQKFDQVICVSAFSRDIFLSYIGLPQSKVRVIYNVLDVESVLMKGQQELPVSFSNRVVNLCTVGRLNPQKGFDRLLEVIKKLKDEGHLLHLRILGGGDLMNKFQDYLKTNQLEDTVSLLGFQSNPYPYVKHSDLFVCSSRTEGFSTAVSEAIILEVPVLTTECSGMGEILEDGKYGVIVANSTEGIYNGLKKMLENPDQILFWKQKAKERRQYFLDANHVKTVEDLLNQI